MIQDSGVIIALGYIFGLLVTALPGGGFWLLGTSILFAVLARRIYVLARKPRRDVDGKLTKQQLPLAGKRIPHPRIWLIAGLIGFVASFYLQWRTPQPSTNDVSKFVPPGNNSNQEQLFTVRGKVLSVPRMTRSQRGQFWMEASQIDQVKKEADQGDASQVVTGKLYATVPLLQSTGLVPGQEVRVTGVLYKPKAAANPGGFDFKNFWHRKGHLPD